MTALESVFIPGGDGGSLDWEVIANVSRLLHEAQDAQDKSTHAGVWVCIFGCPFKVCAV